MGQCHHGYFGECPKCQRELAHDAGAAAAAYARDNAQLRLRLAALERVATAARLLREDYKVRINVFLDRTQQTRLAIEEADSAIAALDAAQEERDMWKEQAVKNQRDLEAVCSRLTSAQAENAAPLPLPEEVAANMKAARNALRNGLYPRKCTIRGILSALAAQASRIAELEESHCVISRSNRDSIRRFLVAEARAEAAEAERDAMLERVRGMGCSTCAGGGKYGPQSFQTQCKGCVDATNWTPAWAGR